MSHVSLGLLGTSWDVPPTSQVHSLVPCPRCPTFLWDYLGHPGLSKLQCTMSMMSNDYLWLYGTFHDVLPKSWLYIILPYSWCLLSGLLMFEDCKHFYTSVLLLLPKMELLGKPLDKENKPVLGHRKLISGFSGCPHQDHNVCTCSCVVHVQSTRMCQASSRKYKYSYNLAT